MPGVKGMSWRKPAKEKPKNKTFRLYADESAQVAELAAKNSMSHSKIMEGIIFGDMQPLKKGKERIR